MSKQNAEPKTTSQAHVQTEDSSNSRHLLEAQLRECFGRVVYTHKTHEKCADILLTEWSFIKVAQMLLAALTTAGFVATVFGAGWLTSFAGAIISTGLLTLNAYTKDYDHGQLAQKHKQTAAGLWLVREKYLSLLVDLAMGERPIEALQMQRDELMNDSHAIYAGAPATTGKAYKKAQEALKSKEDLTFSEEEIDAFLPKELKRSTKGEDPSSVKSKA